MSKFDIRAVRKDRVIFDERTHLLEAHGVQTGKKKHTLRIAHGKTSHLEKIAAQMQRVPGNALDRVVERHRHVVAPKTRFAHTELELEALARPRRQGPGL